MSKLAWDQVGERLYETGISNGVLYPLSESGTYPLGVAWNGLSGVTESPSGAEANPVYADNIKYLELLSAEDFGGTIEAYTYPDEFAACIGVVEAAPGVVVGQQEHATFGMSYKTLIGNDTKGTNHGYKIHLVYNAKASTSEKGYQTVNDSPEAMTLSWEFSTTPLNIEGLKPSAHMEIDSTKATPAQMKSLEDILYGSDDSEPRLPLPDEVIALFKAA